MKKLITLLIVLVVIYFGVEFLSSGSLKFPSNFFSAQKTQEQILEESKLRIISEESVVIDVVKQVGPSVVTVGAQRQAVSGRRNIDPFFFFFGDEDVVPNLEEQADQYIGSGFIIQNNGIIVTNKHVVSNPSTKYFIVDDKGNKYQVERIYRDPLNDLAFLKVNPSGNGFKPVELGNSSKLQVGQFVIAIGTALGEFRNTVTTGVISGLGRGIVAGSPFEESERLDNVIQTDAAINPGNSGGPLLNSGGQVIGVNVAVSSQGQNIGFALPINIVKDSVRNFNETGQFDRPFLGVSYVLINKEAAIRNEVPEGALVQEVVPDSAADKSGVKVDDIITEIDGQKIRSEDGGLAAIISKRKIGDTITLKIFRDDKTIELRATLFAAPGN